VAPVVEGFCEDVKEVVLGPAFNVSVRVGDVASP